MLGRKSPLIPFPSPPVGESRVGRGPFLPSFSPIFSPEKSYQVLLTILFPLPFSPDHCEIGLSFFPPSFLPASLLYRLAKLRGFLSFRRPSSSSLFPFFFRFPLSGRLLDSSSPPSRARRQMSMIVGIFSLPPSFLSPFPVRSDISCTRKRNHPPPSFFLPLLPRVLVPTRPGAAYSRISSFSVSGHPDPLRGTLLSFFFSPSHSPLGSGLASALDPQWIVFPFFFFFLPPAARSNEGEFLSFPPPFFPFLSLHVPGPREERGVKCKAAFFPFFFLFLSPLSSLEKVEMALSFSFPFFPLHLSDGTHVEEVESDLSFLSPSPPLSSAGHCGDEQGSARTDGAVFFFPLSFSFSFSEATTCNARPIHGVKGAGEAFFSFFFFSPSLPLSTCRATRSGFWIALSLPFFFFFLSTL